MEIKLSPAQCSMELAGNTFRHLLVVLKGDQQLDILRETPGAFRLVQANRALCVTRGDWVTVMSADGLVKCEGMTVTRAIGGDVFLGKPLRLVNLEPEILYENALSSVVPVGTGFSIKSNRGHVEERVYASVEACKTEMNRRQPVQVT